MYIIYKIIEKITGKITQSKEKGGKRNIDKAEIENISLLVSALEITMNVNTLKPPSYKIKFISK